jgi:hypothetical protein
MWLTFEIVQHFLVNLKGYALAGFKSSPSAAAFSTQKFFSRVKATAVDKYQHTLIKPFPIIESKMQGLVHCQKLESQALNYIVG